MFYFKTDVELPGERFFTGKERQARSHSRGLIDDVVEAMRQYEQQNEIVRIEFNFRAFLNYWPKINSQHKSDLDPAMVWREIFTFIKGTVQALKLDDPDREMSTRRFLSHDEYMNLPRKQSRLNNEQRQTVYELYKNYEEVKRKNNLYDAMDIVYNIAGRVNDLLSSGKSLTSSTRGIFPIDALFVDEVQDFTMAELYLLVKLSKDPNNLMLAGDTAQSITEGVAFRFTDVRQIFFELFGGIEPDLLQLTHNYRSHSGILRMAACVVELLYFFFSDSLDRLPPDLGLFDGPKPTLMEVNSYQDLSPMFHGSQKEASRIEFGAHQCILVRNAKAKKILAEEFGIEEEWIMTVSFLYYFLNFDNDLLLSIVSSILLIRCKNPKDLNSMMCCCTTSSPSHQVSFYKAWPRVF